jgi:hypothetical protein
MPAPTLPAPITPPHNVRPALTIVALLGALVVLFVLPDPFGVWSSLILALITPPMLAVAAIIAWCSFIEPALLLRWLRDDRLRMEQRLARTLASVASESRAQRRRELLAAERDAVLERARYLPAVLSMRALLRSALRKVALSMLVFLGPILLLLLLRGSRPDEGFVAIMLLLSALGVIVASVITAGQAIHQSARQQDRARIIRHVATIDELAGGISLSEPGAGEGELEIVFALHGQLEQVERGRP